jgi:hypothetical protein
MTDALQTMVRYSINPPVRIPVQRIEALVVPWMYFCMLC